MLKNELPKIITGTVPGPNSSALLERRAQSTLSAVRPLYPATIKRAEGAMIEDLDGNYFLDWVGGVGVLNIGHSHPEVVVAVKEQADLYFHAMFNILTHEGYIALAEKLNQIVPVRGGVRKTYFANSGAEADENAVKIARSYTKRPNIIVFSGAFHGRTLLTMAMTSKKSYSKGLGPFPDGVYRAEFPYLYRAPEGLSNAESIAYYVERFQKVFEECSAPEQVAAVVLEPLQGEGGFIPAPIEWVKAIRQLCDHHGILLIADEVQSGFGRTGRMFACDRWAEAGCAPDIISTAKSIAGGVPMSACTARAELCDAVVPGTIGGTYGGNALACAAALKVIEIMERDHLPQRGAEIGEQCMNTFLRWKDSYEVVGDVRGLGCMIGIEFVKDKKSKTPNTDLVTALMKECYEHGLLIENAGTYSNVIRFLAPLVMTDAQLQAGLDILEQAIQTCTK
ncbi:MAG: gabT [Oscillospiraceae bacterium]|nr:gabT [Oscillospiraceae bacterium]